MPTFKPLTISIRLPPFGVDVVASAASLTGIGSGNQDNRDACNSRFVAGEHPQLVKRPVVGSTAFSFGARLLIEGLEDIAQVLKRQRRTQQLSLAHQLLADLVVDPFLEPSFSATEPSQKFSGTSSAFARDVGSYPAVSIASVLQLLTAPSLTRRSGGKVTATQIHTYYLGCLARWWGGQFNRNVDVVAPIFFALDQSGTGRLLTRQQRSLVISNQQLEGVALVNQRHSNFRCVRVIDKRPSIQTNAGWSKLLNFLGCLQICNHATNRLTDVIRLRTRCLFYWLIGQMVKLGSVIALMQAGSDQDLIASFCKPIHRAVNYWSHIVWDLKLTRYRQGLGHAFILLHPLSESGKPRPAFLPAHASLA